MGRKRVNFKLHDQLFPDLYAEAFRGSLNRFSTDFRIGAVRLPLHKGDSLVTELHQMLKREMGRVIVIQNDVGDPGMTAMAGPSGRF